VTTTETSQFESLAALPDVHIPLTLTVLSPISHGAGTSGNTQLLRTREVVGPDGSRASVPYVSGNSLRHTLRAAMAWHLVRTLEVEDGSLSKRVVDLLWSGGALTTTGNQADLDMIRRVHQLVPGLGLFGYSAKSDITAGTLWVDDVELVCAENAHRLPPRLADHPHASMPNGAFRSEVFGTRHDVLGTPVDRFIKTVDELVGGMESVQMIHDMQVIKPGATLYTGLHLVAPTFGHLAAFATAVTEAMPTVDGRPVLNLGGKRATGYGQCAVELDASWKIPDQYRDVAGLVAAYEDHLRTHRAEILTLLEEITG